MNFIIFVLVFFSIFCWIIPHVFLWADRRIARVHATTSKFVGSDEVPPKSTHPKIDVQQARQIPLDHPQCLEQLARATRSQMPARDALIESLQAHTTSTSVCALLNRLQNGSEIDESLRSIATQNSDERRFFNFVRRSFIAGIFIPQSLEQAASILREENRQQQELLAATAQARLSARILTLLPYIVLTLLLVVSATSRHAVLLAPSLFVLLIGVLLNRIGWQWIRQMIKRTHSGSSDISIHLAEELSVSLRAGISIRDALEIWSLEHDATLNHALVLGQPLSDSLREFGQRMGGNLEPLMRLLLMAENDGLPVLQTINQLSAESRQHRRHHIDIQLRQLPTKLALPIVLFVLPSFVLLTVAPLVIANLSHFHFSPPIITTPQ